MKLDETTLASLAGVAQHLGAALGNDDIGRAARAAVALASLLQGNGPVADDVAKALRFAVKAHEARVFAALDGAT